MLCHVVSGRADLRIRILQQIDANEQVDPLVEQRLERLVFYLTRHSWALMPPSGDRVSAVFAVLNADFPYPAANSH
jgi:hypothetical protein